jgi:hypothetical protein
MPAPLIATVDQGSQTATVAASVATDTPITTGSGYLGRILVTSTNGAAAINIYDNATTGSGKIIGTVAAAAAVGTVVTVGMPYFNGITVKGAATNGAITVSYS